MARICVHDAAVTGSAQYLVVGKEAGAGIDRILMCYSTDNSTWYEAGWVDRSSNTMLKVYGDSIGENIKLQRTAYDYGGDCDFTDWYSSGGISALYMYGEGGWDRIWGSDRSDSWLEAEYVVAYDGDDYIVLQTNGTSWSYAYADDTGEYADTVVGSSYKDYIWGGDGKDTIYGNGGDDSIGGDAKGDYIEGGAGMDIIYGGTGLDTIYGGDQGDVIYGEGHDDDIYGGGGYDYLYGGGSDDYCACGDGGGQKNSCEDDDGLCD